MQKRPYAYIIASGSITKEEVNTRSITIVSVALGLGYGLGSNAAALTYLPEPVRLIFGGSIGSMLLTACGGNNSGGSSSSASAAGETSTAAAGDSSAAAESADPFGKYDPPISMTFARTVDNDLNDNILPKTPGETIDSNRWLDLYSDDRSQARIYGG